MYMYVCMYVSFFLQRVPLASNTTCSSVHLIHFLLFWQ